MRFWWNVRGYKWEVKSEGWNVRDAKQCFAPNLSRLAYLPLPFAISRFPFHLCRFTTKMKSVIYLSIVTASISFTITETRVFKPVRELVKSKNSFLGELFSCGYCFGHWVAFALVAICQPNFLETWWLLDYFFTALVIAWLSAFQWIVMCLLMEKAEKWREKIVNKKWVLDPPKKT